MAEVEGTNALLLRCDPHAARIQKYVLADSSLAICTFAPPKKRNFPAGSHSHAFCAGRPRTRQKMTFFLVMSVSVFSLLAPERSETWPSARGL